ncbi:MAG: PEP-CTERM sorting domain-containing protein [Chthoniobacterales bacterium]
MKVYPLKSSLIRSLLMTAFAVLFAALATVSHAQIFVSNSDAGTIGKYNADGTVVNTSYITTGGQPYGMTLNGTDLYVGTLGTSVINKYNATSGATISAPLQNWAAAVSDVAYYNGNIYAAYYGANKVGAYSATVPQSVISHNFITGIPTDHGIAITVGGILYVTSYINSINTPNSGTVGSYNATTGAAINASLITGLTNPWGLAVDASGNIYVASDVAGTSGFVGKYSSLGATLNATLITGLDRPLYLALDGSGDIFVSNYGSGIIGEYTTSGGNVNASLISGLTHPTGIAVFAAVPEPSSVALLCLGAGAIAWLVRRKTQTVA